MVFWLQPPSTWPLLSKEEEGGEALQPPGPGSGASPLPAPAPGDEGDDEEEEPEDAAVSMLDFVTASVAGLAAAPPPLRGLQAVVAAAGGPPARRPLGVVVAITGFSPRRAAMIGYLQAPTPVPGTPDGRLNWRFQPSDARFPKANVHPGDVPGSAREAAAGGSLGTQLWAASLTRWAAAAAYPLVVPTRCLGAAGDLEAETAALVAEYALADEPFSEAALADLPPTPWAIPGAELAARRDLRSWRIFSIDPPTARDLDDALSIEALSEGGAAWRVGVHIADVAHFVPPGSALDGAAAARATSAYLTQRVIPMLPRLLCEQLCSRLRWATACGRGRRPTAPRRLAARGPALRPTCPLAARATGFSALWQRSQRRGADAQPKLPCLLRSRRRQSCASPTRSPSSTWEQRHSGGAQLAGCLHTTRGLQTEGEGLLSPIWRGHAQPSWRWRDSYATVWYRPICWPATSLMASTT